jgi:hypothetical protein
MLEPHYRYCVCDECVKSIGLALKYPPPFSWPEVLAPSIATCAMALFVWLFS